ncbi:MAG: GIY-YIG nuclease family protein [Minisyncoccota bacterium]
MPFLYKKYSAVPACRQAGLSGRMHSMYYLYILQSSKDSYFYTGLTKNIKRRLQEHNSGRVIPTKTHTPFKVVYTESFATRGEARSREKFFKTGSGRELRTQILSSNIPR